MGYDARISVQLHTFITSSQARNSCLEKTSEFRHGKLLCKISQVSFSTETKFERNTNNLDNAEVPKSLKYFGVGGQKKPCWMSNSSLDARGAQATTRGNVLDVRQSPLICAKSMSRLWPTTRDVFLIVRKPTKCVVKLATGSFLGIGWTYENSRNHDLPKTDMICVSALCRKNPS